MINKKYLLVYIWSLTVLVLIGTPMEEYQGNVITYYDKFAHAFLFGVFAWLLFNAKYAGQKQNIKKTFYHCIFASAAFAGLCELIQIYVPGRTESWLDFMSGIIGALVFLSFSVYVQSRKK